MNTDNKIELDGLEVSLFRDPDDGRLTVTIYSEELDEADTIGPHEIPRIRVVNDSAEVLDKEGRWKTS